MTSIGTSESPSPRDTTRVDEVSTAQKVIDVR
jgi:hypothetical protein